MGGEGGGRWGCEGECYDELRVVGGWLLGMSKCRYVAMNLRLYPQTTLDARILVGVTEVIARLSVR